MPNSNLPNDASHPQARRIGLLVTLLTTGTAGGASAVAWHLPDDVHDAAVIAIIVALIAGGQVANIITRWWETREAERRQIEADRREREEEILRLLRQLVESQSD